MGEKIFLIAVGFIPAMLILAITQYYLWEKSKQYFLLSKYENAIKDLDFDRRIINLNCTILCELSDLQPSDPEINQTLKSRFNNADKDYLLNERLSSIEIISVYDKELSKDIRTYLLKRHELVLVMLFAVELLRKNTTLNRKGIEKEQEEFKNTEITLRTKLEVRLNDVFKNPISKPFVGKWPK